MHFKIAVLSLLSALLFLSMSCKTKRRNEPSEPISNTPQTPTNPGNDSSCQNVANLALTAFPAVAGSSLEAAFPNLGLITAGNDSIGYSNQLSIASGYVCQSGGISCHGNEQMISDYISYRVCPFNTTSKQALGNCVSGTAYSSAAVPDLNGLLSKTDTVVVTVRACVNPGRAQGGENCSPPKQNIIALTKSTNQNLVTLDKQLAQLNQQIQDLFSNDLANAGQAYLRSLENNSHLTAEQQSFQTLATNLKNNPYLFASHVRDGLFEQMQSMASAPSGVASLGLTSAGDTTCGVPVPDPGIEVNAALQAQLDAANRLASDNQAQIDTLTQKIADLSGSTGSPDDLAKLQAQLEAAKASNDQGKVADLTKRINDLISNPLSNPEDTRKITDLQSKLDTVNAANTAVLQQAADAQAAIYALQHPTVSEPQLSLNTLATAADTAYSAASLAQAVALRSVKPLVPAVDPGLSGLPAHFDVLNDKARKDFALAAIKTARDALTACDAAYVAASKAGASLHLTGAPAAQEARDLARQQAIRDQVVVLIDSAASTVDPPAAPGERDVAPGVSVAGPHLSRKTMQNTIRYGLISVFAVGGVGLLYAAHQKIKAAEGPVPDVWSVAAGATQPQVIDAKLDVNKGILTLKDGRSITLTSGSTTEFIHTTSESKVLAGKAGATPGTTYSLTLTAGGRVEVRGAAGGPQLIAAFDSIKSAENFFDPTALKTLSAPAAGATQVEAIHDLIIPAGSYETKNKSTITPRQGIEVEFAHMTNVAQHTLAFESKAGSLPSKSVGRGLAVAGVASLAAAAVMSVTAILSNQQTNSPFNLTSTDAGSQTFTAALTTASNKLADLLAAKQVLISKQGSMLGAH